eukprot:6193462-Pleurochrysis_carterae.AAC.2
MGCVCNTHKCSNTFEMRGRHVQGSKKRGLNVYNSLYCPVTTKLFNERLQGGRNQAIDFLVSPTGAICRKVCRQVYLAHFPMGPATLKRIVKAKRLSVSLYEPLFARGPIGSRPATSKTAHVIVWWRNYASKPINCRAWTKSSRPLAP